MRPKNTHSPWGASGLYRYKICPRAAAFSVHSDDDDSSFSIEGTNAHTLAETTLRHPGKSVQQVKDLLLPDLKLEHSSILAVRTYVRHVRQLLVSEPGGWLLLEVSFELPVPEVPKADGNVWGTCDAVIYFPGSKTLHVIDYKNGVGVDVDVFDNDQLKTYALGALLTLKVPVEKVVLHIVQPRSATRADEPVQIWECDPVDIFEHRAVMIDAIRQTIETPDKAVPGDHCHFCNGDGRCMESASHALDVIPDTSFSDVQSAHDEYLLPEPTRLDDWQLAAVFCNGPRIRQFLKAVEGEVFKRSMAGDFKSDAVKLVRGKSNRVWDPLMTDAEKIVELASAGVPLAECYTVEVPSPAQAETLLKEHLEGVELVETVRDFNVRHFKKDTAGLRLVPATDKGIAVKPVQARSEGLAELLPPPSK